MFGGILNNYLRKFDYKFQNPWASSGFFLFGGEGFIPVDDYRIGNVLLKFSNMRITIEFYDIDCVLGCAIPARIVGDNYSFDENLKISINGKALYLDKSARFDNIKVFNIILGESSAVFNTIVLEYTQKNAYEFNRRYIYFVVDEDHADTYYYDLEYSKRAKKRGGA